jgi:cell division protein FtsW
MDGQAERWGTSAAEPPAPAAGLGLRWRRLIGAAPSAGFRGADRWLLVTTVLLVGVGIVMIYSASAIRAQERFGDPAYFLKKQAVWVALGLLAMSWGMVTDLKRLQRLTPVLLLGAILLLGLVLVPGVGVKINGARRWLRLLGLSFQPAEFAKLTAVLFLASYFARRQDRLESFLDGFLPPVLVTGALGGLIILQPNFGSAVVLLCTAGMLFFAGRARLAHMLGTLAVTLPGLLLLMWHSAHGRTRLLAMMDPEQVSERALHQLNQSVVALGVGGWFGRGLGNGMQKLFFLPEPYNDFIFAILGEELGFLGTLAVVLCFTILLWRGTRAAVRAGSPYASYLALGLTGLIVGQAVLNMGVVTGLLPTTGVPLPFLSFGGSSTVISLFGVGLLLNVSRGGSA